MITVELDIFSGEPNPSWVLSRKEENELLDQLEASPSLAQVETAAAPVLGYRGYIIHLTSDGPARRRGLKLNRRFRMGGIGDRSSEGFLLGSSEKPNVAPDVIRQEALNGITSPPAPAAPAATAVKPDSAAAPLLVPKADVSALRRMKPARRGRKGPQPGDFTTQARWDYWLCRDALLFYDHPDYYNWWSRSGDIVNKNNCYNFAANRITNTIAIPGREGGARINRPHTCGSVHDGLMRDGHWTDVGCYVPDDDPRYATPVIAVCVRPDGYDFHFYRLVAAWDPYGRVWAHKIGPTPATNKDGWGAVISDPYSANRGGYTDFCGYYFGDAWWQDSPNYFDRTFKVWVQ
jgi:hypothetical protein